MNDIFDKQLISALEKPELHNVTEVPEVLELPNAPEIP